MEVDFSKKSWFDEKDVIFTPNDLREIKEMLKIGAKDFAFKLENDVRRSILIHYKEISRKIEHPSVMNFFESKPYEGMEKIIWYLSTKGILEIAGCQQEYRIDCVTGKQMVMKASKYNNGMLNDGVFYWTPEIIYYVENYNMKLPKSFERYVLEEHYKEITEEEKDFFKK